MKLSELVDYKLTLDRYDFVRSSKTLIEKMRECHDDASRILGKDQDQKIVFGDRGFPAELEEDIHETESDITRIQNDLDYYKSLIDSIIEDEEQHYIKNSENRYIQNILGGDTLESVKDRVLVMSKEDEKRLIDRINAVSDWKYPGLLIRPENHNVADAMGPCDPLYLCDEYDEIIDSFLDTLSSKYRYRIAKYQLDKIQPRTKPLKDLPEGQFGLLVMYNMIDHMPLSMIRKMFENIHSLMRPGGTVIFTFNDCDLPKNIRVFEQGMRTYTPLRLVRPMLEDIGFKMTWMSNQERSICEVRMPGTLKSLRGGQALARINFDPEAYGKKKPELTGNEIELIRAEAIALGIDSEEKIRGGAISVAKLELLIKRREEQMIRNREVPDWKASNTGYEKGDMVAFGKDRKIYEALRNIEAKQRFDSGEWRLVE